MSDLRRILKVAGLIMVLTFLGGCNKTIHMAASSGDFEMVTQMLEEDPQLINKQDSFGMTPLHWAVDRYRPRIVDLLIERKANLNIKDNYHKTPLEHAIDKDHRRAAMTLILNGAELPDESESPGYNKQKLIHSIKPLHLAVREGDLEKVKRVVTLFPGQVHVKDDSKRVALYWAARSNHVEIVQFLVEKGSDINSQTDDGWAALHTAAYNGRLEAATTLLQLGAEVDIQNDNGQTPLYWAARNGHLGVVKLLLAKGADPGAKAKNGTTPISQAKTSRIKELLEKN
jgi:ankyrin repeat protein